MFLAGRKYSEICDKLGCGMNTLKARITRDGWREEKEKLQLVEQGKAAEVAVRQTLPELSKIVRTGLAEDVAASVERLKTHVAKDLKQELLREQMAGSLTKRAGEVFAWSAADSSKSLINVQLMGSMSIGSNVVKHVEQDNSEPTQAIDVE
jgi:hypothetical protein